MKSVIKDVRLAIDENSGEVAAEKFNIAQSVIARTAKKGVVTKKTASRKISRLAKQINKINA